MNKKRILSIIAFISYACITYSQAPANDDCINATSLTPGSSCTNTLGTNLNATDSGVAHGCANYSGGDVWFSVVVPASGVLTITTSDAGGITDTGMEAYDGCGGTSLGCDDDGGSGTFSELALTGLTPGSTIYIAVWEYGDNATGDFNICAVEPGAPPPGSGNCGNAIPLNLNTGCTTSGDMPAGGNFGDPTGQDGTDANPCNGSYAGGDDFFFEYTAGATREILNLDLFGTATWTGLQVSNDCDGTNPTGDCVASSTSSATDESVSFTTCPGQTYYIHVSTWPSPQSIGQFCLNASVSPFVFADVTTGGACSFKVDDTDGSSADALPICGGETFAAGVDIPNDAEDVDTGIDYGCLLSTPNPAWFYFEIDTGGDLEITIDSDTDVDIDYALWGPFSSVAAATCQCDYGPPVDCDYTTADGGTANFECAEPGDIFILLVTNFSNTANNITVDETGGTATTDCSLVPIRLLEFNARAEKDVNIIEWQTASEFNTLYQTVEYSDIGNGNWRELQKLESHSNSSSIRDYLVVDDLPSEMRYYRLRTIDVDGSTEVFERVLVNRDAESSFELSFYPNPVNNTLYGQLDGELDTDVELEIFNSQGLKVSQYMVEIDKATKSNASTLDTQDLDKGLYILQLRLGTKLLNYRLFKSE